MGFDNRTDQLFSCLIIYEMQSIELNASVLQRFKPAKIIKDHSKDIVGMDFSNDGEVLYVADSQTLNIFSTSSGTIYRKLFMKIHEIEQLSHTHHNSAILVATKKNHLILYWSIHENRVIKMFKGHTDSITNLMINPKDDSFLTTSNDNTMRIWNLNSKNQGTDNFMQNVTSSLMWKPKACPLILWPALTRQELLLELPGQSNRKISN